MLNTINAEFLFNDVWFTDKNSKPLETEDMYDICYWVNTKYKCGIQLNQEKENTLKDMVFSHFQ